MSSNNESSISSSKWQKTNEPLPQDDVVIITSILEGQKLELSKLDRDIHDLQKAIEARRPRQAKLRDAVDAHKKLTTSGRRLPTEIMQQIFMYCRTTRRLPLLRKEEVPILLTRVCRFWRDLALDMPALWDRVHIPISRSFSPGLSCDYMGSAERWLEAAKENPLTISIYSNCNTLSDWDGALERFLRRQILGRARHIRHLILEVDHQLLNLIADTLPPTSWPTLEKVTLKRIEEFSEEDHLDLKPVVDLSVWDAPQLRRIEWDSVKAFLVEIETRWSKFEEIRLEREERYGDSEYDEYSASEAHAMVRDSPNMKNLKVSLNADGDEFVFPTLAHDFFISWDMPLVLNYLTTLELADVHTDPAFNPITFLQGLQLPALETLSYQLTARRLSDDPAEPSPDMPHGDAFPLTSFLRAQKHPILIKSFCVPSGSSMSQDDFVECLKLMPLLERVWVGDWRRSFPGTAMGTDPKQDIAANSDLLKRLQPPGRDLNQVLCPRLDTVRFDRMEDVEFEDVEAFMFDRLALAQASPLSNTSPNRSAPQGRLGVARIKRIRIGMTRMKPDHVPRDYSSRRGRPSCALEEDLLELGVDARFLLWCADYEQQKRRYTKENYEPYDNVDQWVYSRSGSMY